MRVPTTVDVVDCVRYEEVQEVSEPSLAQDSDALSSCGGRSIGRYRIRSQIAVGGMGVVFSGHDPSLGRDVAIKLLLAGHTASLHKRARFRRECSALARIDHPNVVRIHVAGEHRGCPYLVMDLVPGRNLEDLLDRGPLQVEQAVKLIAELGRTLEYVHACSVVHRDVKPSNVILTPSGKPVLTDFGVCKDLLGGEGLTRSGMFVGTPGYWAPEQAAGEPERHGPATDVYGLGATLYAALTGHTPLLRDSIHSTLEAVRWERPVPPSRIRAEVDRELEAICLMCLEKDPRARYPSAAALAFALEEYLASRGRPRLQPRPVTPLAFGLGLGLSLSAGLLWGSTQLGRPPAPPSSKPSPAPVVSASASPRPDASSRQAGKNPSQEQAMAMSFSLRAAAKNDAQDYAGALRDVEEALRRDPELAHAHYVQGYALAGLNRRGGALRAYDRAIALDPELAKAYLHRGRTRRALKDYHGSLADLNLAVTLRPGCAWSRYERATTFWFLGRHQRVLEELGVALRLRPRFHQAWDLQGGVLLRRRRYARALKSFHRARDLEPRLARYAVHCGMTHVLLRQYGRALEHLDVAVRVAPKNRKALRERARVLVLLGRYEQALQSQRQLLTLTPQDSPRADRIRAWIVKTEARKRQSVAESTPLRSETSRAPWVSLNREGEKPCTDR